MRDTRRSTVHLARHDGALGQSTDQAVTVSGPLDTYGAGRHLLVSRPFTAPSVTPEQILLVRSSWATVAERDDVLTASFYTHLFTIDQSAARLFTGVDMSAQRKKLVQTLGVVVRALDDIDSLLPALAALGKRHARYGVVHHHFESVGEALLHALGDALGSSFTSEFRAAWAAAYALIASVMQRALARGADGTGPRHGAATVLRASELLPS